MILWYEHSPLTEAVFEVFVVGTDWREDTHEQIAQRIAPLGFTRTELVSTINVQFRMTPAGPVIDPTAQMSVRRQWRPDNARMAQFAPHMCAFNALKPYTHYVEYLENIEQLFDAYRDVARPEAIQFLGQRYINQISLPPRADPAEYFTVYPALEPGHQPTVFALQVETELIENGRVVANLVRTGQDSAGGAVFNLDLYARTSDKPPIRLEWDQVRRWQDEAHAAVKRSFENALREKCKAMLGRRED